SAHSPLSNSRRQPLSPTLSPQQPGGGGQNASRSSRLTNGRMQGARKRNVIRRKAIEPKSSAYNDPDPRDGGVQSVDRALSIIETLAEDDEGYRLSDLAVRTGLSTSTVHRLLATLEKRPFFYFAPTESKWHGGAQIFSGGATFARRRIFAAKAMPYLRKLR